MGPRTHNNPTTAENPFRVSPETAAYDRVFVDEFTCATGGRSGEVNRGPAHYRSARLTRKPQTRGRGRCIGCKNCVACAPRTFAIEEEYGRARVQKQACASCSLKTLL